MSLTIHRLYFPHEANITSKWIRGIFSEELLGLEDDDPKVVARVEQAKKHRKDVRTFARDTLRSMMVEAVRAYDMRVGTWEKLCKTWADDDSDEMAAAIWNACYGIFDARPGWEYELESRFMTMHKWKFVEKDEDKKSCIARTFTSCKNILVKAINEKVMNTHKRKVTISRSKEQINNKTRFKKRKKGMTLCSFVKGENKEDGNRTAPQAILLGKVKPVSKI